MLSPLNDNILWVFTSGGYAYELNLKDSSWKRLDYRFGKYAYKLDKEDVKIDERDPDLLWLSPASSGLAIYHISNGKLTEFPDIKGVTAITFPENEIITGTLNGLFRIDRSRLAPIEIEKLAELPVNSIVDLNDNTLLINEGYIYNYQKNTLSGNYRAASDKDYMEAAGFILSLSTDNKLYILKGADTINSTEYTGKDLANITVDDYYIWIPDNLKNGITRYSIQNNAFEIVKVGYDYRDFNVSSCDSLIWFLNPEGFLVFNKKDLNAQRVFINDTVLYSLIYADSAYLIAGSRHTISLFRKDFLLNHTKNVRQLILEETPFFSEVSDMISTFKGDFASSHNKYVELYQKYNSNPNIRVQQKIAELKESLLTLLPESYYTSKDRELFITDTIKDDYLTGNYYLHMVKQATYEGLLKEALHYDSLVSEKYPLYRTPDYIVRIKAIKEAQNALSRLKNPGIKEDERLWETGKLYYKLHMVAGPQGKYSINMTYPFSFLKKLKNLYPVSQFADNAEFMMIRHVEQEILAGGDEKMIQKVVNEYNALLKKYPASELKPDMYHRLAWLYYNIDGDVPVKRKNLELAAECISTILKDYPGYLRNNSLNGLDEQIITSLDKARWDLKLILDKRTYNLNEPVTVTFELLNTDSKPKTISIPEEKNIPGFILEVERYNLYSDYYYAPASFEPDYREYSKSVKDTLISADAKYTERWNINDMARNSDSLPPGKFIFKPEGRYKITARPADPYCEGYLQSNTIWITVRNTDNDHPKSKTEIR